MQPAAVSFRAEFRAIAVRLLAYACGIVGLAIVAAELFRSPPVVAAIQPAVAAPDWVAVERPNPAFEIALPELGAEPAFVIERHARGGGRKDIVAFGEPGRSLRYLMLEIYRPGTELGHFGNAAAEIAARAQALGPAGEMRASLPLETKFGPFETVDFAAGRFGSGHCVGFVRSVSSPRLQIAGISCSMDTIVDRGGIACALDRLMLLSSGRDPRFAGVFARAEVNRKFCGQRDPLMYATPKRPMPVEAPARVQLRGSLASR